MKLSKWNVLWGALMVVGGGMLLLEAPDVPVAGPVWAVLFSAAFAYAYLASREDWWAIIPGGALLTIALFIGLSTVLGGTGALAILFFGLA